MGYVVGGGGGGGVAVATSLSQPAFLCVYLRERARTYSVCMHACTYQAPKCIACAHE
jgi:hypothetical protein